MQNRERLLELSPDNNGAYLETIETAAFVLCLDDGAPTTREERVRQAFLGDGFNRWHDKSTQFIVAANGRSAQLFEHSAVDGLTVRRLTERIQAAIDAHEPKTTATVPRRQQKGGAGGHPDDVAIALDEYALATDPTIDVHILKLRQAYRTITSGKAYAYHTTPHLGKAVGATFPVASGGGGRVRVSPKACVDLAIQLASRLHFGHNPGSWEPVSTQHFHRGRPEIVQVATDAVARFCDLAAAGTDGAGSGGGGGGGGGGDGDPTKKNKKAEETREALVEAARQWDDAVRRASEGRGFLRLLDVLNGMSGEMQAELLESKKKKEAGDGREDGKEGEVEAESTIPALFRNETVFKAFPGLILQTINDGEIADAAIMLMPPESLWMSYSIRDEM